MPKRKNLNGIPHNIIQSFFGTERYYYGVYRGGYMGDWLLNTAKQLLIPKASLDLLRSSFDPPELNIHPLVVNASTLKDIIFKELSAIGFENNFIVESYIDFEFPAPNINKKVSASNLYNNGICCVCTLMDIEGRKYSSAEITEYALEQEFDSFNNLKEQYLNHHA